GLRELIRPGEQYPFLVITMGSATLDKSDPKNIAAVKKWRAEYRKFYRKIKGDLSIITRIVRNLYFLLPGIVELFIKIINRLIFRGALTETINMNCTNLEDPILVALGKEKYCWNKDE
ncbi:MAG: hypothetical protein HUJ65_00420, partial [Oscillospiraceae bacterium]|nr:hypothetical protein [Oscillospiraceae bacterium]